MKPWRKVVVTLALSVAGVPAIALATGTSSSLDCCLFEVNTGARILRHFEMNLTDRTVDGRLATVRGDLVSWREHPGDLVVRVRLDHKTGEMAMSTAPAGPTGDPPTAFALGRCPPGASRSGPQ